MSRAAIRVAVVAGGRSSEHEISLASARSVLEALDPERYETTTIAIARDGRWALEGPANELPERGVAETLPVLADSKPAEALGAVDVVLPVLHGPFGEDGTVQGLLELAGIPYVGAGVAASALCMDKDLFKAVLRDRGIPVARNVTLRLGDEIREPVRLSRSSSSPRGSARRSGSRRHTTRRSSRRPSRSRAATTRRCSSRSSSPGPRSSAASSATSGPPARIRGRRDRPARRVVRLRGQVRRRAARTSSSPPGSRTRPPRGSRRSPSTRSSRPSARAWPASTSSYARTARWSSTRSTRSPASPRRASTRASSRRRGSRTRELLDRLIELALERHDRRSSLEY